MPCTQFLVSERSTYTPHQKLFPMEVRSFGLREKPVVTSHHVMAILITFHSIITLGDLK